MPYPNYKDPTKKTGKGAVATGVTPTTPIGQAAETLNTPGETRDTGTGFIGFDQYMRANQGGAQQMANQVVGGVAKQVQDARGAVGSGAAGAAKSAMEAQHALNATATDAGREALVQKQYGSGTGGGSQLDAALLGAYGGKRMGEMRGRYGDLEAHLSNTMRDRAAAPGVSAQQAQIDRFQAGTPDAAEMQAYGDWQGAQSENYVTNSAAAQLQFSDPAKLKRFQDGRPTAEEYDEYIGWMQGQF